jgi:tetratricopeptide (TPR) repeat protein
VSSLDEATRQAIEQALVERDIARAADLAEHALAKGARDPMLLNLVAWKLEERGEFEASRLLLDEALALSPGDPSIVGAIGAVLRKQGKLGEALRQLDEAIRLDATAAAPWLERGMALETGGSLEPAMASYRRAAELDPQSASAFGGVAAVASRRGDLDVALQFAERALSLDPLDPQGTAGMARIEIEQGRAEAALPLLDAALASDLSDANRSNLTAIRGDALDRLGRYAEAYDAYAESKLVSARRFEQLGAGGESQRDLASRLEAEFAAIANWPADTSEATSDPAFIIGFPRSGTTLVENMLASVPGVAALEERPTLASCEQYLGEGGLARFALAGPDEIETQRRSYWQAVRSAGVEPDGKLFIDKDPLKGLMLPLIGRLFPAARIIVMRRDPRDVVLSCFRSNFALTPAALEFTSLERAARHYDAVMRGQEAFLSALPLARHELRYEALVTDFESESRQLCEFLGIEWSAQMRDFARTARRRGVSTMSATQVSKPLYDGSKQWRRYEEQLGPILPILEPWVKHFGYGD